MAKVVNAAPSREAIRINYEGLYPSPEDALCEGIDNSFDYRSDSTGEIPGSIHIAFDKSANDSQRVVIADDARGMDIEDLENAMKIQRQTQQNGSSGAYGTGLKSMMDYMSDSPCIITRKDGGKLTWTFYGASDGFNITLSEEGDDKTDQIKALWKEFSVNPESNGTIVIMDNIKHEINVKAFKKILAWKYNSKVKNTNVKIYVGERR